MITYFSLIYYSKCVFGKNYFCQLILLFSLFLLLFMVSLHFLVLFIDLTVLFQLMFTFVPRWICIDNFFFFLVLMFIDLLFIYNIEIKVNEYVKIKLFKMNF